MEDLPASELRAALRSGTERPNTLTEARTREAACRCDRH